MDQQQPPASHALPLFASEPTNKNTINKAITSTHPFPALPDSPRERFAHRMVGFFSLSQWQELELQALIYKYMLVGAPVPLELILPIRKSLFGAHPLYRHFPSTMLQSGYWGRVVVDPEPGRCRRTDGKKWRCSKEVVTGQKYCERHVHRGRNHRSRKHVEIPTPTATSGLGSSHPSPLAVTKQAHFTLSGSPPTLDILPFKQRRPDEKTVDGFLSQRYSSNLPPCRWELQANNSNNRILRSFFDDWPRSHQEPSGTNNNDASPATSTTHLSMSIADKSSSDISLKLSTGNDDDKPAEPDGNKDDRDGAGSQPPPQLSWSGWGNQGEASMGGPLAEALRSSSVSTHSPTSVLQKPNGSVSGATSSIST